MSQWLVYEVHKTQKWMISPMESLFSDMLAGWENVKTSYQTTK